MAPALLPSLFLLFTLSRKHRLSLHSLVCLSAALFPSLPCAASPLLITPINIFNFCHFSPRAVFPSASLAFLFRTGPNHSSYENCSFSVSHQRVSYDRVFSYMLSSWNTIANKAYCSVNLDVIQSNHTNRSECTSEQRKCPGCSKIYCHRHLIFTCLAYLA